MRFSARSFSLATSSARSARVGRRVGAARPRALHRLGRDDAVGLDEEELLGRRAQQRDVAESQEAAMVARARGAQCEVGRGRIGVHVDVDAVGEAQLVGVAAHDRGLARGDEFRVARGIVPPAHAGRVGAP